ncbi:MAG: UDP-3-O-(3-hydroxymyristoyl)glucosamine N-acyltransferase [Thermostichales cyanobacterium BF4_bins_65]
MRLGVIAEHLGCELYGDPDLEITGVAALPEAQPGELSFLGDPKYLPLLASCRASALIVPVGLSCEWAGAMLRSRDPRLSFAQAIGLFHRDWQPPVGIHPTAVVGERVEIGAGVGIAAGVVIGDEVKIGPGSRIHPNVTIYPRVQIGADCVVMAGAVLHERTVIGDRCVIHCGAVIGDDGFGYVPLPDGSWQFMPQSGRVVLGNDVHIGSNTTVDRPAVGETYLADGVKIDNLVMVAHGVKMGPNCLLVGQVGLAGGVKLGERVIMGGQSGAAGHITVGDHVTVVGRTGITSDVEGHQVIAGFPHQSDKQWRRVAVAQQKLPELLKTVRQLEKRIQHLEQRLNNPSQ